MATRAEEIETPLVISPRGQITLPKRSRERLGLKGGSVLLMREKKGRLVLAPAVVTPIEYYSDRQIDELVEEDLISSEEREAVRRRWIPRRGKPRR